jgi:hypothetical protein
MIARVVVRSTGSMKTLTCRLAALLAALLVCASAARADEPRVVRLGSAGRGLAAAATAADFNGDGRADRAVAERAGGGPGAYRYAIDVDVAGGRRSRVAFTSAQSGLDIEVADVDADHDADIVVVSLLTRVPLTVWVNDGRAGFSIADPARYARATRPFHGRMSEPAAVRTRAQVVGARTTSVLARAIAVPHAPEAIATLGPARAFLPAGIFVSAARPRGPPR